MLLPPADRGVAAVAILLREGKESLEVFFIERAQREGDPWSGHMAFPGGRLEPDDASERITAERETAEEVGLVVAPDDYLGRLDDLGGMAAASRRMVVSAHVYHLAAPRSVELKNDEVASAFWFPLDELFDPKRHLRHRVPIADREIEFPGIALEMPDRHIVWGLTYRFLDSFMQLFGRSLAQL